MGESSLPEQEDVEVGNLGKNLILWLVIGALLVLLFNMFQQSDGRNSKIGIPFSDFVAEVGNGQVREVMITGKSIEGFYTDGRAFRTYAPDDPNLVERLTSKGVVIRAKPMEDGSPSLVQILIS